MAARTDWRQALREGLFTALGYKQNSWPMRRLTELLPDQLDRDRLAKRILPRDVWTFHGLRLDKRPVRRLCFFPISCIGIRSKKDKKSICKGRQFR